MRSETVIPVTNNLVVELHPDVGGLYGRSYVWLRRLDDQMDGVVYLDEVRALIETLTTAAGRTVEMVVEGSE